MRPGSSERLSTSAGADGPLGDLLGQVPHDPWYTVRVGAMVCCALTYLWWTRTQGLITDRISATVAVAVFVACAFIGKPWIRWAQIAGDAVLYAGMWFAYECTRGAADGLGFPWRLDSVRAIDRVLFLGVHPTEWVQHHWYRPGEVRWYDEVLSLVYFSHFVVPVVAIAAVWATSRTLWARYMRRFATVVGAACVLFVVMPTVPPWMASDERFGFGVGTPLVRHVRRGILELGFQDFAHDWRVSLDWSNVVAAMPSLHAAFSLFVVVFFAPMIRRRWLRIATFAYPLTMAAALVYFAEHWVIDVLAGWALVAASFGAWNRLERSHRVRRADAARSALVSEQTASDEPVLDDRSAGRERRHRPNRNPAVVMLGRSMLDALADPNAEGHPAAVAAYQPLVERYRRDEIRLAARADHLGSLDPRVRRGALAPVASTPVAAQYRRQSARWNAGELDKVDPDVAVTLVVAARERAVSVVATPA
jgi:hypothetical protein